MGTIECILAKALPVDHVLTGEEKKAIIEENKDIDISHLSLIKECLSYDVSIRDLLMGWGGVQLIKIDKE